MTRQPIPVTALVVLLLGACDKSQPIRPPIESFDHRSKVQAEADRILASGENANVSVTLECPVSDFFLDGSKADPGKTEQIHIEKKTGVPTKTASGATVTNWGPVTEIDSKITSNGKSFESSLVKTDGLFAAISYADRNIDGISSNILAVTYLVDLTNYKFKRIVSRFPYGSESSFTGQCKVLANATNQPASRP